MQCDAIKNSWVNVTSDVVYFLLTSFNTSTRIIIIIICCQVGEVYKLLKSLSATQALKKKLWETVNENFP